MLSKIFLITLSLNSCVKGQGVLPNGDPFFCVPPGICAASGGIDPRIMTPTGTSTPGLATCPSGMVPCYAQGSMSNCGMRLVRGAKTADGEASPGAYPWQAYMTGANGNYIGSGSLISPYHVLTATHKILQYAPPYAANPSQLRIIMGVHDPLSINASNPTSRAAQIFIYNITTSPYNNLTLKNDIAIIRLATPIRLVGQTSVNTICLPSLTSNAATYISPQRCLVSGWGQTQPGSTAVPTKLKQVGVPTRDMTTCARKFTEIGVNTAVYLDQTGGQLCAGGEPQKDACFQDGGAPLTCGAGTSSSRFTVAGIVIWGKSCGQPDVYGVYTNVPFYLRWIRQIITQRIT